MNPNLTSDHPRLLILGPQAEADRGWSALAARLDFLVDLRTDAEAAALRLLRTKPGYYLLLPGAAAWSGRLIEPLTLLRRPAAFLLLGRHDALEPWLRDRFPTLVAPAAATPDSLPALLQVANDLRDEAVEPSAEPGLTRKARRSIFERSPVPMAIVRADATVVSVNRALAQALGAEPEGLQLCPSERLLVPRAVVADLFRRLQTEPEVANLPVLTRDAGGLARHLEVGAGLLHTGGEQRLLLVWTDLTARMSEATSQHVRERLEALGRLAAGVAHHLNNLLTPVYGYAEMLEDAARERDTDTLRSLLAAYAGTIRRGVQRASAIIDQLVIYSRQGRYHLEAVEAGEALGRVLQAALDDHGGVGTGAVPVAVPPAPGTGAAGRRPVPPWRCDCTLPAGVRLLADRALLERALRALIDNALEAMPSGGTLTLSCERHELTPEEAHTFPAAEPGPYVRVTVADTGRGMSEALQRAVFEPFFTTKEVGAGEGLGLALVAGVVKGHGGYLELDSAPGAGSTFRLLFPAPAAAALADPDSARRRPLALLAGGPTATAREVCRRLGWESLVAHTPAETRLLVEARGADLRAAVLDAAQAEADPELLPALRRRCPDALLVLTGDPALLARQAAPAAEWRAECLPAPLAFEELERRLAAAAA